MKKHFLVAAAVGVLGMLCLAAVPTTAPSSAPKSYKPDDEGFIRNWIVLDPIALDGVGDHSEDVEKPMFNKEYFKDQLTITPKVDDKVTVAGKALQWREVKIDDFQIDLAQFATDHNFDPNSCLFWGVAYIDAPEELKDVKLAIGSDDSSAWWVNGKEVIRDYAGRAVNQDDDISQPLTLQKGLNVVRFAVIQGDGPTGACARFLDKSDKPVKTYTVTLVPPPAAATAPAK